MNRRDAPEALLAALAVPKTATAGTVPVPNTGILRLPLHAAKQAACNKSLTSSMAWHVAARRVPADRVIE